MWEEASQDLVALHTYICNLSIGDQLRDSAAGREHDQGRYHWLDF